MGEHVTTPGKGREMWGVKAGPPGHRIREEDCPEGLDSEPRKRKYPGDQALLTWGEALRTSWGID